jgi:hypothetical protein
VVEIVVIFALALNGIVCTAALVWLLGRAGRRREREWPAETFLFQVPDKIEPPDPDPFGAYPAREILDIMAEHYPGAYARYRSGRLDTFERIDVWDACCAIHDARFEIEELCS